MNKMLLTALTLVLVIGTATVVLASSSGGGDSSPSSAAIDISGPCDEAEHANDPRCTGNGAVHDGRGDDDSRGPGPGGDHGNDGVVEPGEDISGPCDEAEHANDPECAGVAVAPATGTTTTTTTTTTTDDDDEFEDNSGPSENSGPGSVDDDDDLDDDGGDDSSGPGGDDDDD